MTTRAGTLLQRSTFPALVLDHMDVGILIVDTRNRVAYLNRKGEEILEVPGADISGRDVDEALASNDDRWHSSDPIDTLGSRATGRETTLRIGGREVTIESSASPLKGEEDEILGTLVTFSDYSEGEADAEFQRTVQRLASLGELSAVVAHEIRNPLTGIRTTVQYVGSKLAEGDPKKDDLQDVIKEIDRIEQIITELLVFARPPAAKMVLTDVNEVVEKSLDNLSLQFDEAGVTVKRDLADDAPPIAIDPDMMQQVFLNIILNAVDAMAEGGTLRVTTSTRRYRSRRQVVEIAFSDTGVGIPPENLDKIFDPFFTTRPSGTGLGLTISLQIVREHGGRITVRNRSQGGATFRITMPVPETEGGA
jgi:two-component system sensor histidine kinase HydH